jgi:hypothetical protein
MFDVMRTKAIRVFDPVLGVSLILQQRKAVLQVPSGTEFRSDRTADNAPEVRFGVQEDMRNGTPDCGFLSRLRLQPDSP